MHPLPLQAEVARHLSRLSLPHRRLQPPEMAIIADTVAGAEHLWRPVVRHDPAHRWYARLHRTADVEVWLLGWEVGQDTRIHDHGGAGGAFTVAEGRLVEHHTDRSRNGPLRRREHVTGGGAAFGPTYVHDLAHHGPGRATSVHVYSPPLTSMTFYQVADGILRRREAVGVDGPEPGLPGGEVVERGVRVPAGAGAP